MSASRLRWVFGLACALGCIRPAVAAPPVQSAPTTPVRSPNPELTASESARALLELTSPEEPEYPALLFRLGVASADEALTMRRELEIAKREGNANSVRHLELDRARDRLELQAIESFTKVVADRRFQGYARRDEAVFEIALLHEKRGEATQMRRSILQLIRDYPTSTRIPGAYLLLGDYLYQQGSYDAAGRVYEKVTQFSGAAEVGYAHYRKAWCFLAAPNGGHEAEALRAFVEAIDHTDETPAGAALRSVARRDLVQAYASVGKPSRAYAFFRRVGRGPAPGEDQVDEMLQALAQIYTSTGRRDAARKVRTQQHGLDIVP